jgi:hypothetical protein
MASRTNSGGKKTPRIRKRAGARALAPRHPGQSKEGAAKLSSVESALRDLHRVLTKAKVPFAVIGGIAVIAWGFGRATLDIDAAVAAPAVNVSAWLPRFARAGFVPRIAQAAAFAERNYVLLLRHEPTGIDIDVSFAQLEFELEALANTQLRKFGAIEISVPHPTDLIVYKMIAGRPRDLQDTEELLARSLPVDHAKVERLLREFDALLELDRLGEWKRLLRRLRISE